MKRDREELLTAHLDVEEMLTNRSLAEIHALWTNIITGFLDKTCDQFGFNSVGDSQAIERIKCFADWQPPFIEMADVTIEWSPPIGGTVSAEESFALFEYDEQSSERIKWPMFHWWNVEDNDYPSDRIYFFRDGQLVLRVEPFEIGFLFCNLSRNDVELLIAVDDRIHRHLNENPVRVVTSSVRG
jgi:hypothetical protein